MISVLTINHNNSEMSFLEKFSFNKDNLQEALLSLKNIGGIDECMILSTCNRVELYVSSDKNDISFSLIEFLSKFHSTNIEKSPVIYQYLTADIFVLPTLAEGMAIAHLEAMACGLPIITTPNCGSVVSNSKEGFIVPIRDSLLLASKIEEIVENRCLRNEMSIKSKNKAMQYTWQNYNQNLLSALKL